MRILVVGGNGSLGRELIPFLLAEGHLIVVLDKELGVVRTIAHPQLSFVQGGVEEEAAVKEAMAGVETVIHLAWSFSDDPRFLLDHDLRGHVLLLEAARAQHVSHFIYTSTAVVYGKPLCNPINEDHPLRVLEARKPAYGIAKQFAEHLTMLAANEDGFSGTVLRFWWAFGTTIAGKHLRDMLKTAAQGHPIAVPAKAGGSFLCQEDFNRAVLAALKEPRQGGRVFNLASSYVTWEEVAGMATSATGASAGVQVIPAAEWKGAAFLADAWELDTSRIRDALGFSSVRNPAGVRDALAEAIAKTWENVRSS